MDRLQELLTLSASRHSHLCPRQVLGVRMGLLAGKTLGIEVPQSDKRLFTFAESDGCGTGGISVATGCWVDRRTLRVVDYGKLAATFVATNNGEAIRIKPHPDCRAAASQLAPDEIDAWHSQLLAYQSMPDELLLVVEPVRLKLSLEKIISQPGLVAICECCGEEISNEREITHEGQTLCRSCAGDSYYCLEMDTSPQANACGDQEQPHAFATASADGRSKPPIPVVTLVGKSGNGKTTLMEKIVGELTGRGYRIATVKHNSHTGFEIDQAGKDSWMHAQTGSRHVVIASPDKFASYRLLEDEISLDEILADIHEVDIILVEGYKRANKPSIEVLRADNSLELISDPKMRFAIATDVPISAVAPQFDLNDFLGIADLLESTFLRTCREDQPASFYEFRRLYSVDEIKLVEPDSEQTERESTPARSSPTPGVQWFLA